MLAQVDTDFQEQITNTFEDLSNGVFSSEPESLQNWRKEAFSAFMDLGFPTIKNEDWKYTNVKPYLKSNFTIIPNLQVIQNGIPAKTENFFGKELSAYTVYVVNGKINFEKSNVPDTNSVRIQEISESYATDGFLSRLKCKRDYSINPFLALNNALFTQGIYIEVEKNFQLDKPIHLVHLSDLDQEYFQLAKNVVIARQGSHFELIESVENTGHNNFFRNASTEILVEPNATFNHYKLQKGSENIRMVEHTEVEQQADSQYNNYTFTFPGYQFVRNNLNLALTGSNIESHMYGLYLTGGKQLVDNHTLVDHQQPHCESNQLYKGIMMDKSRAVFNGKVYVHPIAQITNAFQQNNNILFSDNASVYSKPQLEIFADDVKCSHGSTIGQLDPEALFYLRARGISESEGRSLLVNAFAFDVAEKIENPEIRELLENEISKTMTGVEY